MNWLKKLYEKTLDDRIVRICDDIRDGHVDISTWESDNRTWVYANHKSDEYYIIVREDGMLMVFCYGGHVHYGYRRKRGLKYIAKVALSHKRGQLV
jgi:hypothetical protein